MIHGKDGNCCSADLGQAEDPVATHFEMILPSVLARIKKPYDPTRRWVDSGEVRTLMPIAKRTGKREVFHGIILAMLSRNDVLYMKL